MLANFSRGFKIHRWDDKYTISCFFFIFSRIDIDKSVRTLLWVLSWKNRNSNIYIIVLYLLKSLKLSERPRVLCRLFLAWTIESNRTKKFIIVRWRNLGQNHADVGFWRPSGSLEVCYFGRNKEYHAYRWKPQADKVYYGRKIFKFYRLRKMFADFIKTFSSILIHFCVWSAKNTKVF